MDWSVMLICSMDRVRTFHCGMQLTAARFWHQLHLSSKAGSQIGVHRRLRHVPDSKI